MGNKKDILPIVMASAVALVITGIVRWMIPGGTVIKQQPLKKELSLPDIPLMIKSEQKKAKEIQVLVTSTEIKKDERIVQAKLSWKTWPSNAVQPYFIAQDSKGIPLNNRTDYTNALNMWAKNEIPAGIPLTLSMLTSDDPVEIARKKKEAEEAEKAKKLQLEKKKKDTENLIKVGYRAVPFQVDQRTPISKSMISPGDYVDVIINSFEGNKQKTHVYKGLKIIAIDGVTTKQDNVQKDNEKGGLFGSGISFGGASNLKNITLEVKESLVNVMLKQAGNSGITITLRSQREKVEDTDEDTFVDEDRVTPSNNNLIKGIWEMNRSSSAEMLKESARKRQEAERNISALLHNMNSLGVQTVQKDREEVKAPVETSSKYEVVSGRIVSETENKKKEEEKDEPVKIYRKLTPDEVQFYKNGKRVKGGSESSSGTVSSGSRSR
ncbi:MAG: hypothetical protein J5821_00750 [Alphaproteobacteria bacterium]|nr:hypothetical protein [Alphaproteobacteria bacterium]